MHTFCAGKIAAFKAALPDFSGGSAFFCKHFVSGADKSTGKPARRVLPLLSRLRPQARLLCVLALPVCALAF
jgi:hypothetical protein